MSKAMKPSAVLTRAAKWIDEHGLAKGQYFKYRNGRPVSWPTDVRVDQIGLAQEKGCKACAWGGLYIGAYEAGASFGVIEDRADAAATYVSDLIDTFSIPAWNDNRARTKDEVVAVLKDAAKAARKDGK